jgi:lathosterol oxidase
MNQESKRTILGEGLISGYLSIFFSLLSLGAVICFLFPEYLTTAEFRVNYPIDIFRWMIFGGLVFSFLFAFLSLLLSKRAKFAFIGMSVSVIAIVLGGSNIEVESFDQGAFSISLDWLILEILALSLIFIPLELFFPKREDQSKFHPEWRTDLIYLFKAQLLIQYTAVAVKMPAELFFSDLGMNEVQDLVSGLPFIGQLFLAMFVADLFQYFIHRLFHVNPFMWRFHSIHHSIQYVDWIAGSRLHLVDILITRSFSYIPLYILGFSNDVFYVYVVIVALQAVMAHTNVRIPFSFLKYLFVTPQFHHWHHSKDKETHDKNFAIHFPFIDKIFGTYHLPVDEWPEAMGLEDESFPKGYLRQQIYPFFNDPKDSTPTNQSLR